MIAFLVGSSLAIKLTFRIQAHGFVVPEHFPPEKALSWFNALPLEVTKYGQEISQIMGISAWSEDRLVQSDRNKTLWFSSAIERNYVTAKGMMQGYSMPTMQKMMPQRLPQGLNYLDAVYVCKPEANIRELNGSLYTYEQFAEVKKLFEQFLEEELPLQSKDMPLLFDFYQILNAHMKPKPDLKWYHLHKLALAKQDDIRRTVQGTKTNSNHYLFGQILSHYDRFQDHIIYYFADPVVLFNFVSQFTDLQKHFKEFGMVTEYAKVQIEVNDTHAKVFSLNNPIAEMEIQPFLAKLRTSRMHPKEAEKRCGKPK